MSDEYKIKQLQLRDWLDLKSIRLEALQKDPAVFLRRYSDEIKQADQYWQRSFKGNAAKEKAIFALYDGNDPIGMGGIYQEQDAANSARLGGAYISSAYRGLKLAHKLLSARIDWAKASGLFNQVSVSHRIGNAASAAVISKAGFSLMEKKDIEWPDGSVDEEWIYKLDI